jgi:hypothetical protein
MTGGYVDSEDLDRLLKSPTKATARKCLIDQIVYWFHVGFDGEHPGIFSEAARCDPIVLEIAERYFCEMPRHD